MSPISVQNLNARLLIANCKTKKGMEKIKLYINYKIGETNLALIQKMQIYTLISINTDITQQNTE